MSVLRYEEMVEGTPPCIPSVEEFPPNVFINSKMISAMSLSRMSKSRGYTMRKLKEMSEVK